MISNSHFVVTVPAGSELIFQNGSRLRITEIPPNAFDLWAAGNYVFCLREAGSELLKDLPKDQLENLLETRRKIGYKAEIQLLEKALKNFGKSEKAAKEVKPEKPEK